MARRSEDWNVGLAQDLRDPAFAREFLLAAIDVRLLKPFGLRLSLAPIKRKPPDGRVSGREIFQRAWSTDRVSSTGGG